MLTLHTCSKSVFSTAVRGRVPRAGCRTLGRTVTNAARLKRIARSRPGSGHPLRGRIRSVALRPSFKVHRSRWIAAASWDHGRPPDVCGSRAPASPSRRPGARSYQHHGAPPSNENKVLPTHLINTHQQAPRRRRRAKQTPPRRAAPRPGQPAADNARPVGLLRLPTRAKVVHNRRAGSGQTRARVADRRSADWTAKALGEATEPRTERPPEPR
jgi:hypothetical protein